MMSYIYIPIHCKPCTIPEVIGIAFIALLVGIITLVIVDHIARR